MNNDPYSWFSIDRLDRMIKEQKEELKKKELEEELKDEIIGCSDRGNSLL